MQSCVLDFSRQKWLYWLRHDIIFTQSKMFSKHPLHQIKFHVKWVNCIMFSEKNFKLLFEESQGKDVF